MRHSILCRVAILLFAIVAIGADGEKPQPVIYGAAIFIGENRPNIDEKTLAILAQKFPDLPFVNSSQKGLEPPFVMVNAVPGKDFGCPDDARMKFRGMDLSDHDRDILRTAPTVWVLTMCAPAGQGRTMVHVGDQILLELAKQTGGVIYDDSTRDYYSTKFWQERRIPAWQNDIPKINLFVTIDFYQFAHSPPTFRAVSMGMSKFGLPDVVVNDMDHQYSTSMGSVMNVAMQTLLEMDPKDATDDKMPQNLLVSLDEIRHEEFRKAMIASCLGGAKRKLNLTLAPAKHEEGDPTGGFLELTFADQPGHAPAERHQAAIATLFGKQDEVVRIKHDDELLAAVKRAQGKLPDLRARFNRGLAFNQHLLIKGPFTTTHGGSEWMWVEVKEWPEGEIKGSLANDPDDVPSLQSGAPVNVKQSDVFDYILYEGDKRIEGGETVDIMVRRTPGKE